jgi:hypothetical protein
MRVSFDNDEQSYLDSESTQNIFLHILFQSFCKKLLPGFHSLTISHADKGFGKCENVTNDISLKFISKSNPKNPSFSSVALTWII